MATKIGRKGDPRMHRAVSARLNDPGISLFAALQEGGFGYERDDHNLEDADGVTLAQRKNQLSRRLRLAHSKQNGHGNSQSHDGSRSNHSPSNSSLSGAKRGLLEDDPAMNGGDFTEDDDHSHSPHPTRAKDLPNYRPVVIPNIRIPTGNITVPWGPLSYPTNDRAPSNATGYNYPTNSHQYQQQQKEMQQQHQQGYVPVNTQESGHASMASSGVAVASLSKTAHSVGLTLEQLAINLASNRTLLSKLMNPDEQQRNALAQELFINQIRVLYSKCMLLAGYSQGQTQEGSMEHLEFASQVWQREGQRIRQMSEMAGKTVEEAPMEVNMAMGHSTQQHTHDHNGDSHGLSRNDVASVKCCLQGRHIHRLEGKCGHKAILHQPEDGEAHIDFVVGDKIECYQDIARKLKKRDAWPSKHKCQELACDQNHYSSHDEHSLGECDDVARPKLLDMMELDLDGPEWNIEFQEDGPVLGLFKLGTTPEGGDDIQNE